MRGGMTPGRRPRLSSLRPGLVSLVFTAAMAHAPLAAACPNCAIGQQARRQFWSDDFLRTLAVVLLPFVAIGACCVRAEGIGRRRLQPSAGIGRAAPEPGMSQKSP
jgi:hypothetical protein